jgi:hypothetical protein
VTVTHAAKILGRILRRRIERKIGDYLQKINSDVEEGKELGLKSECCK